MKRDIEKIRKPILIPLSISLISLVLVAIIGVQWNLRKHFNEEVFAHINGLDILLRNYISEDAKFMSSLIELVEENRNLQKAWEAENRDELLQNALPIFNNLKTRHSISHFYFHSTDKINFLRVHNAARFGDLIDRFSLAEAVKKEKPSHGLEIGPFGTLTLRVVHPWHINGQLSGYVELGKDIHYLVPQLNSVLGMELFVFVDKKFLDKDKWQEGRDMLGLSGNWDQFAEIILSGQTLENLPPELNKILIRNQILSKDSLFTSSIHDTHYKGGFVPLTDSSGKRLGEIVVLVDFTKSKALLSKLTIIQTIILVAMVVGLFFIFGRYLSHLEQKIIEKNKALQAEIAEKKQSELARKDSEEQYKDLFENAYDLIHILRPDGNILFVNRSWRETFGYSQEEVERMKIFDLIDADCGKECENIFTRVLSEGKVHDIKTTFVAKNGKKINLEGSANCKYEDGKQVSVRCIFRNVTEQKQLEEKLFQSHKMEAVGTMAGGIAHDFNNILSIILGYSQLAKLELRSGNLSEEYLDQITTAARRATDLIKQILLFSRKAEQSLQYIKPHLIVKECLKMLRSTLPSTVQIVQNIDDECGVVYADPTQIHQIVVNLCTNARHAMEHEQGTLTVRLYRKKIEVEEAIRENVKPGPFIVLSVGDTGHGIDKAIMTRIFEPYFTTKGVGSGTGLGLAVIHGIVQDYNGFILVESEIGKGTFFHIHLPASETHTPIAKEEQDVILPTGSEQILAVDDEINLVEFQKDALKRLGYTVSTMKSSTEALKLFQANPDKFDLVITDQTMPEMTGADMAQEMIRVRPGIPIILCTGYSTVISREEAKQIGIKRFLMKPVSVNDLAFVVRKLLDENHSSSR